ncbi:MAG: TIM-barrel domain-containing protein, partial [Anaerolineae bacterium]
MGPDGSFTFNLALRDHAEVFMDVLHKPLHAQGVDFWWIDGAAASAPGLNGQMWTNKVYYDKTQTYTGKRALIFSRYGGHGSHRYPISFSGDTYSDWGVLRYEITFTPTAGNVLIPYWTHDIGGFFGNKLDDELFVRWVQFGAFSPFLRLHSDHGIREPWRYSRAAQRVVRAFFHLRYRLLPYIYTYSRQVHERALPLCRPLYLEWPHLEEAYTYRHQYLFGRELLVAPIDQPGEFGVAAKEIYFPPGTWVDLFTGRRIRGPKVAVWRSPLAQMPLFARAGAIVPQAPLDMPREALLVDVYAGADGEFELYEDDGKSLGYRDGAYRTTPIRYRMAAGQHCVEVGTAQGTYQGAPAKRAYLIRLLSLPRPKVVEL